MAEVSPQTPLGELTALPRPLAGYKGAILLEEGRGGRTGWKGKLSLNLFLLDVSINPVILSRSTGADEGRAVLNFRNRR